MTRAAKRAGREVNGSMPHEPGKLRPTGSTPAAARTRGEAKG